MKYSLDPFSHFSWLLCEVSLKIHEIRKQEMKQGRKAVTKVSSKNPSKSSSEFSCSTWLSFSVDERKKGPISAEKASKRQKGGFCETFPDSLPCYVGAWSVKFFSPYKMWCGRGEQEPNFELSCQPVQAKRFSYRLTWMRVLWHAKVRKEIASIACKRFRATLLRNSV